MVSSEISGQQEECVHHVDLLSTIKNIDAGDHVLQRDEIPGLVNQGG